VFPNKHAALRTSLWEKGFKEGHTDVPLEVVEWLDKATDAYYKKRFYAILSQVESNPSDALLKQWEDLIAEICGDSKELRNDVYEAVFTDDNVSASAKSWLKTYFH
jgi:hypothetical protein